MASQEPTMERKPESTPEIFVASEFFAKEPQRRASEAMRRDHSHYIALFEKPPDERSDEEVRRVGDIIVDAPWFAQNFSHLRSEGTTEAEQARDLARTIILVTYEPLGGEPQLLCTKGEPVESFDVIVNGSVQVTDDPLVMADVAGSRAQVLHAGQWFGSEALAPLDPLSPGVVNVSSSNVSSTGVRLTLLRLLRSDHIRLLEVQTARQHQLYADILSSLPMLKHYSCRGRTKLATAFSHATFADSEVIVENAATSKSFYILMQGSVKVRKTLRVAPGLSYQVELKVLQEGDIFGGDRFSTRIPVFEDLSFVAQGAIKCMQLSPDHRLLDSRARQLILEEFIALPDETLLLNAFDQQSGWEHEKTQVIKHQFKKAVDRQSRGSSANATAFARPLSRETFTRSSVYIPTGTVKQHGQYRPAISWRHGRNGRHMAETDSQFAQRQAMVGTTRQEWEERLSKCPGSRESFSSRRVATVPLAKSSADVFAETYLKQTGVKRSASVGELKRPPRPITPNDFGAGWLLDEPGGASRADTLGLMSQQSSDTVDTASDATFAGFVGEDTAIAINEMWPDKASRRLRRNPSHTSWGVRAIAATGIDIGSGQGTDLPAPEVKEGFDRLFLRRLVDATVQAAKKTKQTRSTQYYPQLSVLVADVVNSSDLQDCGSELSDILDNIFTQFKELAEGRYMSSTMWGKGRRFIALSGVQHNTDSSCIGSIENTEQDDLDSDGSASKAATWKDRSFEASASYLEARFRSALEEQNRNASNMPDTPTNPALDRLIQLACTMQRCVAHVNCAPNTTKSLSVRIGIATGPAVVGFYGLHNPFPYNCWGWTVDEARRLENAAASGSILVEASAYEAASPTFTFEPQAAVGAIRGGDLPSPQFDYRLLDVDDANAATDPSKSFGPVKSTNRKPVGKGKGRGKGRGKGKGVTTEKSSDLSRNGGEPFVGKENQSLKGSDEKLAHWSRRPGCRTQSSSRVPLKLQASVGRMFTSSKSNTSLNKRRAAQHDSSIVERRESGSWLPPAVQSTASADSLVTFAGEMFDRIERNKSRR